jgi:hypothetical protein
MRSLKKTLAGLGALVISCVGINSATYFVPKSKVDILETSAPLVNPQEQNLQLNYDAISAYLEDYFEDYVSEMSTHSSEIRKNIKLLGKEEVVKGYAQIHKFCLDVAVDGIERETTEEEIDSLADRMVLHQKKLAKETYIDYEHPSVKEGYKGLAEFRVEHFKKIIQASVRTDLDSVLTNNEFPIEDAKLLIRRTFTREQYEDELKKYSEVKAGLYDGFAKSLENNRHPLLGIPIRMFGPSVARKTGEKSIEYGEKEIDEIYDMSESQQN